MELDAERKLSKPLDDVDFSSGFETQYTHEYRPLTTVVPQPPDARLAWYRDLYSILMVGFLAAVFVGGSVLLICLVFTTNPGLIALMMCTYALVALFLVYMEVQSKHVR